VGGMSEPRGPQFDAQTTPAEATDRDGELLEMFDRWERDIQTKRGAWIEQATVWYALESGEQWDEADIAALEERGRIPVVFNMVAPTIDAVCGAEIQNRQQASYFPREKGDTGISDVLTQGVKYISDECNGDMEDSEAFRDLTICGEGWTLTAPEVDGKDVTLPKERVDPLQMGVDPASRKACYADARYLRREIPMSSDAFEDFKREVGRPDATADGGGLGPGKRATIVDPRQRYKNGMLGTGSEDDVIVCEWQWWEREPVHLTAMPNPDTGETEVMPLTAEQHEQAQGIMQSVGLGALESTTSTRKVYYRAFVGGGDLLLHEPLKEGAFRYKAMTGKRDRNKGTWFGLVKPMSDPQRFLNKLYSEIMHIVRTNAKGGMAIEEGAVHDIVQFEQSWAQADAITWLKDGALSSAAGQRMQPKTAPPIPVALFQLMEFARDMVRACTGVNEEILGLAGRDQPGVLEAQRKQAAYGILGPYFDAKRRYTRDWGHLILALIRAYMPKDKLVRVVGKGEQRFVPLAMTMEADEYDVVVDEAPNTPNQKAKVAAVLLPVLQQMVEGEILGPEDVGVCLEYLDLPAALVTELQESIRKRQEASQPDPAAAQIQQRGMVAEIENTEADTEQKRATAFQKATDAHATHAQMAKDVIAPPPVEGPENMPQEIA
jgi:hypothetical protein